MQALHYCLMGQHCFCVALKIDGDFLTFVLPDPQMVKMPGRLTAANSIT
jgi:hypothetical protein